MSNEEKKDEQDEKLKLKDLKPKKDPAGGSGTEVPPNPGGDDDDLGGLG